MRKEITTPDFAYGLQGLLTDLREAGKLTGILNGVDQGILASKAVILIFSITINLKSIAGKKEKIKPTYKLISIYHNSQMCQYL